MPNYMPANTQSLELAPQPQIRLGIQGYGGTGKTTSGMSFTTGEDASIIVGNIDKGLGAFAGRKDIVPLEFHDLDFCKKVNPNHTGPSDLKTTVLLWLTKEGPKLQPEQTLVWDGGTGTENAYHRFYNANKVYEGTSGKENQYAQWRLKIEFFTDLLECFQRLKCNVVYICHEADQKDPNGTYTGKIRPLLTGQMNDKLMNYFTDWFRARTIDKYDLSKITDKDLALWGMTKEEMAKMQDEYPRNTLYFWQTCSDSVFDGKCSSLVNYPDRIPSTYDYFKKYMRKYENKIGDTYSDLKKTISGVSS